MSIQLWHFQNACFQQIWCVAQLRGGGQQLDIHIQILEECFLFFLCMFAVVKLVQNMNLWLPNSPARPAASPLSSHILLCVCRLHTYVQSTRLYSPLGVGVRFKPVFSCSWKMISSAKQSYLKSAWDSFPIWQNILTGPYETTSGITNAKLNLLKNLAKWLQ